MAGTGGKRVTAMPRFNPLIKDDRLLPGYCFSRRETPKPKKKEAPKEELISTDPEHVLSMEADTRKEWFQMALMQAATGVLKSASLYAVILQPAFASTKELKKIVEANMHFFSPKQQKELKKVVKGVPADGAKTEGARDVERPAKGSAQASTDARSKSGEDGVGSAPTGSGDAARGGEREFFSRSASRPNRPRGGAAAGVPSSREERNASQPTSKRKDHRDVSEDDSRSRSIAQSGDGGGRRRRRGSVASREDGHPKRPRVDRRRHDRSRGEGRRPRNYREDSPRDARGEGRSHRRTVRRDSRDDLSSVP